MNFRDANQLSLAEAVYKRIIKIYIDHQPLDVNIGQIIKFLGGIAFDLEKIGAHQEAAEIFAYLIDAARKRILPQSDDMSFLSEMAAKSFFFSKKYYDAARYQRISIDLHLPPTAVTEIRRKRLYLAIYLGLSGDIKAAIDELRQIRESLSLVSPRGTIEEMEISVVEVFLRFQNDQISEARELLEKIQPQLLIIERNDNVSPLALNILFSSLFKQSKVFDIANYFFNRAESYAKKSTSEDSLEVLSKFGMDLFFDQQDFTRALAYSELYLDQIWKKSSERPVPVAEALRDISRVHFSLRDYDRAWEINRRGIRLLLDNSFIYSDLYSGLRADSFVILSSIGALDDSSVEREISTIREEIEKISANDPFDRDLRYAGLLSRLGYAYLLLPNIDKAKTNLKHAEDIVYKHKIQYYDTFYLYMNIAEVHIRMRDYDDALAYYFKALHIQHIHGIPSDIDYSEVVNSIGTTLSEIGRRSEAVAFLKEGINRLQAVRHRLHLADTEKQKLVTSKYAHNYAKLASLLNDQGRLAEAQMVLDMLKEDEQFDFIRRSAGADPRRTRIGYTPTEERWMGRYREIADRLAALGKEEQALQKQAKLGLSEEEKKRQAALAADLKVAQAAFESFLEQMRQEFAAKGPARSAEFAESSVKALAELQDLLKGLGDDVALLRIYLTDEQVNFLLTTPGVQLARNVKIKTQDLNRQVAELNRLLRDPKADPLPAAQALYKLLLAPVEQDLQQAGAKTVMLSLDGVLRYLPFGVLHDGQRYALQRWNLPVYTSVVRERLREAANANWQAAGLGVTRKHGNFDPLPAVRTEMSSIIRTGATGVLPGEVHLDEAFTAQRLKDVSQRRFPVVHVASHFQFSPGTEINSFLLLGDGTQLTLGDIRTQNYRFDDVDLLTLSACDTGLGGGRDQRGREIEGFGVIAQQQGAKAVLATLWKVADSSTATLMGDMYRRRVQGGLSKIEALRQAQMAMAAQPRTAHPFYWAPFVLMGNWK
jgi:CHAT domain-containing protein